MSKEEQGNILVSRCIACIEAKLGWGDSANWSKADFENLSDTIEDATGVNLSVTTLKRLWGKVKYDNKPTVTTLNTLAQFLGFENWRVFAQQETEKTPPPAVAAVLPADKPKPLPLSAKPVTHKKAPFRIFATTALFSVTIFIFLLLVHHPLQKEEGIDTSRYTFSLNKMVSQGVPNSVIFSYDASASPSDSVFIVQTWDISRKIAVPKDKHEYSAIYYYPGYFRAKLMAGTQVVKEKDLMITSDGWLAVADQSPVPVYFDKNEFLRNGVAEVTAANMQAHNISLEPTTPRLRFYNMRDMGDMQNDNFTFETTVKSNFNKGSAICQYMQVLIQCKDDIIIIPLSAKACVGDLDLYFAGTDVRSKDADLSKFGCDLSNWTTLRVTVKDKLVHIYVNNQEAYSLTFPHNPTGIVGVQYRFQGAGAVKDTKFSNKTATYNF